LGGIAPKEVNAMNLKVVKMGVLVALLVAAHVALGVVSGRVYHEYEVLFSPGPELLGLAIGMLGAIVLVAAAAGLVVALVRPLWVIVAGFALSALAMVIALGPSVASVALGLVYLAAAAMYARSVVVELKDRLDFSVRPIGQGQGLLVLGLALLVGAGAALGYREDALHGGYIIPPAFKQTASGMWSPFVESQIESQPGMPPADRAAALAQARQMFEESWEELEGKVEPYGPVIWVGVAVMLTGTLNTLLSFVSWVPLLVLSGVFPLLKLLGVVQVVTETKEAKRLILG
jgi:hypothetical protein